MFYPDLLYHLNNCFPNTSPPTHNGPTTKSPQTSRKLIKWRAFNIYIYMCVYIYIYLWASFGLHIGPASWADSLPHLLHSPWDKMNKTYFRQDSQPRRILIFDDVPRNPKKTYTKKTVFNQKSGCFLGTKSVCQCLGLVLIHLISMASSIRRNAESDSKENIMMLWYHILLICLNKNYVYIIYTPSKFSKAKQFGDLGSMRARS